jgi:hypothetical protein
MPSKTIFFLFYALGSFVYASDLKEIRSALLGKWILDETETKAGILVNDPDNSWIPEKRKRLLEASPSFTFSESGIFKFSTIEETRATRAEKIVEREQTEVGCFYIMEDEVKRTWIVTFGSGGNESFLMRMSLENGKLIVIPTIRYINDSGEISKEVAPYGTLVFKK